MRKFRARYVKIGANPFYTTVVPPRGMFLRKEVELTDEQAEVKDKLAAASVPDGYRFVECVEIT